MEIKQRLFATAEPLLLHHKRSRCRDDADHEQDGEENAKARSNVDKVIPLFFVHVQFGIFCRIVHTRFLLRVVPGKAA